MKGPGEDVSSPVQYRVERGVAHVTLRNPPVNAISHAMRVEMLEAIARANGDASVRVMMLRGEAGTFVAGADIKELGKTSQSPLLPEVLDALEASKVPAVAALEGHALGGGLEIALACHARVAAPKAVLGLPEVLLGLLPGAGGTQRLPRLIGVAAALDLTLTGKPVDAVTARSMGLVDAVVENATAFEAWARQNTQWRKTREQACRLAGTDASMFEKVLRDNAAAWAGQVAPFKIVELIERACTVTFEQGAALERSAFLECQKSPQHKALSYLFFAERNAAKLPFTAAKRELTDAELEVIDGGQPSVKLIAWLDASRVGATLVQTGTPGAVVLAAHVGEGAIGISIAHRLVEIAAPAELDDQQRSTIAALVSLAKRSGKVPVVTFGASDFLSHAFAAAGVGFATLRALAEPLLEAGVVAKESDIDVLVTAAALVPRHLGGPMFAAANSTT